MITFTNFDKEFIEIMKHKILTYIFLISTLFSVCGGLLNAETIQSKAEVISVLQKSTPEVVVNGGTIEISNFSGDVVFEGIGGTLLISGKSTIKSLTIKSTSAVVNIVVASGVDMKCEESDDLVINTISNSGDIVFEGDITVITSYSNFGDAEFDDLDILSGASLVNEGDIDINDNLTCSNSSSITNSGNIIIDDYFYNSNSSTLTNLSGGYIKISDNLENNNNSVINNQGEIEITKDLINSASTVINSGELLAESEIYNSSNGVIENSGSLEVRYDLFNDNSTISILPSGMFLVKDDLFNSNNGTISNAGTFTVKDDASSEDNSIITNSGLFNVIDLFTNDGSSFIQNETGISSLKKLSNINEATVVNDGDLHITSTLLNSDASILSSGDISAQDFFNQNNSTFESSGDVILSSVFTNDNSTATFLEDGTFSSRKLNNYNSGVVTISGTALVTDDLKNESASTLTITESGVLNVNDDLYNSSGATLINNGKLDVTNDLENSNATLTNSADAELVVGDDIENKSNAIITNSGSIVVEDNFTQSANLTNSDYIYVEDTFTASGGSTTTLTDGSILQTEDLDVKSDIIGEGDYSTIYVTDDTNVSSSGSLDGNIAIYDENGFEDSSRNVGETVVEYENIIANKVFSFNGSGQYLKINNTSDINLQSSGTVEAMINLASYKDFAGILHKGVNSDWSGNPNSLASDEAYVLRMGGSGATANNRHVQFLVASDNSDITVVSSSTTLALNKWYHVLATWDANNLYLYINGILEEKVDLSSSVRVTNGDLIIGSLAPNGTSSYYPFDGSMDNVRVWDKYQTDAEVWAGFGESFNSPVSNLVVNMTFDNLTNNEYFTSVSTSALKAYLFNFGSIAASDVIPEEILEPTDVFIDNVVYDYIIINANEMMTLNSNVTCENLVINANGSLVIPEGFSLTINGDLFIKSKATGCGQMFINGDITINGNVHIEHTFKGDGGWEFLTVPAKLTNFKLLGNTFNDDYAVYYYDEQYRALSGPNSGVWKVPSILKPGVGYIFAFNAPKSVIFDVSASEYLSASSEEFTLDYTSSSLSGDQSGWNLIGNPFQTTVSWDKVVEYVENTMIGEDVGAAIYFYDSQSGNYMTYVDGESTNGLLDGTIKPLDAFFVKAYATGNKIYVKRNLFPEYLALKSTSVDKKIIKARLSNETSADETVLAFIENASDNFDKRYDAHKAFGDATICQVYTQSEDGKKLAVNAVSSVDQDRDVSLFVRCPEVGNYELSFANLESLVDESIYLVDKKDGVFVNLKTENTYQFNSSEKGILDRFMIVLRSASVATKVSNDISDFSSIYYFDGYLKLLNNTKKGTLKIVDIQGRNLYSSKVQKGDASIALQLDAGIYIVSLNGISKKILVE